MASMFKSFAGAVSGRTARQAQSNLKAVKSAPKTYSKPVRDKAAAIYKKAKTNRRLARGAVGAGIAAAGVATASTRSEAARKAAATKARNRGL
jgi:transcription initiation factor TFIIIB Brf1 subunit/transcription initiation factor TFIIB